MHLFSFEKIIIHRYPSIVDSRYQWSAKHHVEKSKVPVTCVDAVDVVGNVSTLAPKLAKLQSNSTSGPVRLSLGR